MVQPPLESTTTCASLVVVHLLSSGVVGIYLAYASALSQGKSAEIIVSGGGKGEKGVS